MIASLMQSFIRRLRGRIKPVPSRKIQVPVGPVKRNDVYETVRIDRQDDLASNLYFVGNSPVFLLPAEMLTLQGAHRFSTEHPFVKAIATGPEALQHFYETFRPANLTQMYRISAAGLKGEELAPWELPWLLRERKPPVAEVGLGIEHGVSYYGPCSPQKVIAEHERLTSVALNIKQNGYLPDTHNGHIEGHFLQSGKDFRFFVRGGKHRAAALTYLGFERIPVRVRLTWPRVVSVGTEEDWPLVRSGEVDQRLAAQIFERYFQ